MTEHDRDVDRRDVARGAGTVALSRLGALIEVVAQPAYTWLFGVATYGLYTALWAAVNIVENVVDLSMTGALQRVVPQARDEAAAHAAVKAALLIAMTPATLAAVAVAWAAPAVASLFNAAAEDQATLVQAVRLFAWAIPLWTFVEVATAAVRARRAFGPEIRLRIFWEQLTRLGFALAAFGLGILSLGLVAAHLASLAITAALSVRLLLRHYEPGLLLRAPVERATWRLLLATGLSLLPSSLAGRLFNDMPAVLLNAMLPGAAGATAAGLYGIARKVASIPMIIRQTFTYVLAPLASAQARRDRAGLAMLYSFASRVSTALVVPLAMALILLADEILGLFAPEARAALPLVIVLVLGRALETIVGPATPIVEMTGHRRLPLLNAIIGLAVWLCLTLTLVPAYGAYGMAVAVACAFTSVAYAAVAELWFLERLTPFDRRFLAGFATAAAASGAMAGLAYLLMPISPSLEVVGVLILLPVASWFGLRFGLSADDRMALGPTGRRMRLWRPTLA